MNLRHGIYNMCSSFFDLMVARSFGDPNFLQISMHFQNLLDNCLGLPVKDVRGIIIRPGDRKQRKRLYAIR
jgi:hypothetical protein